jgi:hypothetical protein
MNHPYNIIDVLTALLTPTIAILGAYIAIQQYRLAKEKHRLEIYDRRMRIYSATLELIRNANRSANINEDIYYKFEEKIAEAEFLFGKEVVALLEDISRVGFNILLAKREDDYQEVPTDLTDANLRHADLMNKFLTFEFHVRKVFSPYFRLPISQVRKPTVYNQKIADTISEKKYSDEEDISF